MRSARGGSPSNALALRPFAPLGKDRLGGVEREGREMRVLELREAQPANAGRPCLAHERHHRFAHAHGREISLDRGVDASLLVDLPRRLEVRQAFGLAHQRGDLMHPDQRRGRGEAFDPAGEHEHAGRGAGRAAGDRRAGAVRTFRRGFRTVGDQRPGDGDREALGSNEFAHGPRVGDRAARRMDEDRQPAAFEVRNRIGEGLRRAGFDPALGRQPFRTIWLAGRVSARHAHETHRRRDARPRSRPQVSV